MAGSGVDGDGVAGQTLPGNGAAGGRYLPRTVCTATRRVALLVALCAAACGLLATSASAASTWSRPQGFAVGTLYEPAPRAAIAADGTSAVVWRSRSGGLVLTTGRGDGRFSAPRTLDRAGAGEHAVAVRRGGGLLVAWQRRDGLWVAVRTSAAAPIAVRRVATGNGEEVNGVQVAADALGGWVVAERRLFTEPITEGSTERLFYVRALTLAPDGALLGDARELGAGAFGIDGRQAATLAVDGAGRAVLAFDKEMNATLFARPEVLVATRPHGGAFSPPLALAGDPSGDPHVAVGDGGRAIVAAIAGGASASDAVLAAVSASGALGVPFGPLRSGPRHPLHPSVALLKGAAGVLVFQAVRDVSLAEGPVYAVALAGKRAAGPRQTLYAGSATEPIVLPLRGGRALAMWLGRHRLGAAVAGPDGRVSRTPAPAGPPPSAYHSSSTNRHLATGGDYAILAWAREAEGRVRVSVRRFSQR